MERCAEAVVGVVESKNATIENLELKIDGLMDELETAGYKEANRDSVIELAEAQIKRVDSLTRELGEFRRERRSAIQTTGGFMSVILHSCELEPLACLLRLTNNETYLCEIIFADEESVLIGLWDPKSKSFSGYRVHYPQQAIFSVTSAATGMTGEEFVKEVIEANEAAERRADLTRHANTALPPGISRGN